jgi:LmbE family N-acetylglucosaminyl deacetylase
MLVMVGMAQPDPTPTYLRTSPLGRALSRRASREAVVRRVAETLTPLDQVRRMLEEQVRSKSSHPVHVRRPAQFDECTESIERYLDYCERMLSSTTLATGEHDEPSEQPEALMTLTHWVQVSLGRFQHLAGDFVLDAEYEDFEGHELLSESYRRLNASLEAWNNSILRSAPQFEETLREQVDELDEKIHSFQLEPLKKATLETMLGGLRTRLADWQQRSAAIRQEMVLLTSLQSDTRHRHSEELIAEEAQQFLDFLDAVEYVKDDPTRRSDDDIRPSLAERAALELQHVERLQERRNRFLDVAHSQLASDALDHSPADDLSEHFSFPTSPSTGRTVLVVQPHPDDETTKGARTTVQCALQGDRVVLVCMTDGSAGDVQNPHVDRPDVQWNFAEQRRSELERASAVMGFTEAIQMGYGDSGMSGESTHVAKLSSADHETVVERLAGIIEQFSPAWIITVQDEHEQDAYAHPDHLATFRLARDAARVARNWHGELFAASLDDERDDTVALFDETDPRTDHLRARALHAYETQIDPMLPVIETDEQGNAVRTHLPQHERFVRIVVR